MNKENFFLVSSSIKSLFPKKEKKLLMLGEWCKTNLSEDFLNNYKISVLPYHWKNSKKTLKDYKYIVSVYQKIITDLTNVLNKTHKRNFSRKYWNITIGPWLIIFITAMYDRFRTVNAIKNYNITGTYTLKNSYKKFIPQNHVDATNIYLTDAWNNHIFTFLIKKLSPKIKIKKIDLNLKKKILLTNNNKSLTGKIKKIIRTIFISLTKKNNKDDNIFIITSYLKFIDEIKLQIKVNKKVTINVPTKYENLLKPDLKLRNIKLKKSKDDKFTFIVKQLIMENIPISYLEGYKKLVRFSEELPWPKKPRLIFSSNSHFSDDVFKIWLAEKKEKNNTPFISGQHGGSFLTTKFFTQHKIDFDNCDKFLFWGNKKFKNKKVIPLFNIKSVSNIFKRKIFCDKITLVQDNPLRYTQYLNKFSSPFSELKMNIKHQNIFIKNLNSSNKKKIKIKLGSIDYLDDYENYEINLWKKFDTNFNFEKRKISMEQSIKDTKLVICTTLGSTVFLESLTSNIPTFIFTNYNKNLISDECRSDYEKLKKIGIINNNPYKFAKFINKNFNNIDNWWNSKNIKIVINDFVDKYCSINEEPIEKLNKILNEQSRF
jgi:putative transferase (TIGR04331 family)